jgi:hypothetical protein
LVSVFTTYASFVGIRIINGWDITSGNEKQLILERKTYLISTILNYVVVCQLFSLFLFICTADHIHSLFVGAMCAAGTLHANNGGYLSLVLKIVSFMLCGVWMIINHVDNKTVDYPLIKFKYKFLLLITTIIIVEAAFQLKYFLGLDQEIITSCCGTLFSEDADSVAGEIAHLPSFGTKIAFYAGVSLTLGVGIHVYVTGKGARLFSCFSTGLFFLSLTAVISFISLYFYELPTHHCPFCILHKEYHYIGYLMYLSLFGAGIAGGGLGVIDRFRDVVSLKKTVPLVVKRLCFTSIVGYAVFAIISMYPIIFSDFKLEGY